MKDTIKAEAMGSSTVPFRGSRKDKKTLLDDPQATDTQVCAGKTSV